MLAYCPLKYIPLLNAPTTSPLALMSAPSQTRPPVDVMVYSVAPLHAKELARNTLESHLDAQPTTRIMPFFNSSLEFLEAGKPSNWPRDSEDQETVTEKIETFF